MEFKFNSSFNSLFYATFMLLHDQNNIGERDYVAFIYLFFLFFLYVALNYMIYHICSRVA